MFRFSLLALLSFTALAGLGFAPLAYATPLMANITLFAVVLLLSSALVAALYAARPLRVFAGGFAVCGWVYFSISSDFFGYGLRLWMITDDALRLLDREMNGPIVPRILESGVISDGSDWNDLEAWRYWSQDRGPVDAVIEFTAFAEIGHALWAILFGLFGGGLALLVARRREVEFSAGPVRK